MTILRYGEDDPTYCFLSQHLGLLIERLGRGTAVGFDASKCLILFRPSPGRRGGDGSCQLGEFDAIVATPGDILLIESRWLDKPCSWHKPLILKDKQSLKQTVFMSHRKSWQAGDFVRWDDLRQASPAGFDDRPLPAAGQMLVENMQELLVMLAGSTELVRDVLLFFNRSEQVALKLGQGLQGFDIVKARYDHGRGGRYFPLPSVPTSPGIYVETVEVPLHE